MTADEVDEPRNDQLAAAVVGDSAGDGADGEAERAGVGGGDGRPRSAVDVR